MAAAVSRDADSPDDGGGVEERKGEAAEEGVVTPSAGDGLALVPECHVCADTAKLGFVYGCGHTHCLDCATVRGHGGRA